MSRLRIGGAGLFTSVSWCDVTVKKNPYWSARAKLALDWSSQTYCGTRCGRRTLDLVPGADKCTVQCTVVQSMRKCGIKPQAPTQVAGTSL